MSVDPIIYDLLDFINHSPTAWHAVDTSVRQLEALGFQELKENALWEIQQGQSYYVSRNGSSLCAFVVPTSEITQAKILASHTDSPALKLKPNSEFPKQNMMMLGVEVYGGPLLSSWLNRDLGIAGRISYLDQNGTTSESLITIDDHPLSIPQLAIHLDRQVNEIGLILNKQEHLSALAAILPDSSNEFSYLKTVLKEKIEFSTLLDHDLFLFPLEAAKLTGFQNEFISGYRIDSLNSVHAALTALSHSNQPNRNQLKMVVFWDNEEVGSNSAQGASSPFLTQILERITLALNMNREQYLRLLNQSLCLSIDLGHALHPNYTEKHDPSHQPLLGKGIVLKFNAQQRYVTDSQSASYISALCHKATLPLQKFVVRSDIPCGSTIGPIHASATGMKTVDIGCPQLSMHSIRELASCQDHLDMCKLLKLVLDDQT